MSKFINKQNALVCFEDEFTLHRIAKLIGEKNGIVTKCTDNVEFQNYLYNFTYDIVICGLNLQTESSIELIKVYRFAYPLDDKTKFYLFDLDKQINHQDMLDAKLDGLIATWDLTHIFTVAEN